MIEYKNNNASQEKKQSQFCAKYLKVEDELLRYNTYLQFRNVYKIPVVNSKSKSVCNFLSIVEMKKFDFINNWNFFDQVDRMPSTLSFIGNISDNDLLINVEFLRQGKYDLPKKSIIMFPSCFTFAFRINPILTDCAICFIGSILWDKS